MQDENTTDKQDSADATVIEPTLSLGSNPSDQTQDSTAPEADTGPSEAADAQDASASIPEPSGSPAATDDKPEDTAPSEPTTTAPSSDLEAIRSSALQELGPIVSELDQEPEDKYRTLMMLIQASDDQSLIKDAYESADKIEDKKAKAEALLGIINEINYFTGKVEKAED